MKRSKFIVDEKMPKKIHLPIEVGDIVEEVSQEGFRARFIDGAEKFVFDVVHVPPVNEMANPEGHKYVVLLQNGSLEQYPIEWFKVKIKRKI